MIYLFKITEIIIILLTTFDSTNINELNKKKVQQ